MRIVSVLGAATLLLSGVLAGPAAATEELPYNWVHLDGYQTCDDAIEELGLDEVYGELGGTILDKVDVEGDQDVVTVTADEGFLIGGYCVKAGSDAQEEGGVYFVMLDDLVESVDITFPWAGGKDVSHYAVVVVPEEPEPSPSPTPSDEVSPSPSPTPSDEVSPSPSPTPSDEASPTPSDGASPTPSDEASPTPSASPSDEPLLPLPSPSTSATPTPVVEATQPPTNPVGAVLAQTGPAGAAALSVLALTLVGGGATLLMLRKRRAQAAVVPAHASKD